jgi:hypothetical protein
MGMFVERSIENPDDLRMLLSAPKGAIVIVQGAKLLWSAKIISASLDRGFVNMHLFSDKGFFRCFFTNDGEVGGWRSYPGARVKNIQSYKLTAEDRFDIVDENGEQRLFMLVGV